MLIHCSMQSSVICSPLRKATHRESSSLTIKVEDKKALYRQFVYQLHSHQSHIVSLVEQLPTKNSLISSNKNVDLFLISIHTYMMILVCTHCSRVLNSILGTNTSHSTRLAPKTRQSNPAHDRMMHILLNSASLELLSQQLPMPQCPWLRPRISTRAILVAVRNA